MHITLKWLANVIGPLVTGLLRVLLAATVMLPFLLQVQYIVQSMVVCGAVTSPLIVVFLK